MKITVLGAGPVGRATSEALLARSSEVHVVSRHPPQALAAGITHHTVDVLDSVALARVTAGSAALVQCLGAPYDQWADLLVPLQAAAVAAARRTGARLVSFENLYPYGPPDDEPLREDHPLAPCSVKGRVRAAMVAELDDLRTQGQLEVAHVRASDLFGATVRQSALGEELIGRAIAGKSPRYLGDLHAPHTWTYVLDAGATLARVAMLPTIGRRVFHVPSSPAVSQAVVIELLANLLGRELEPSRTPPFVLRLLGLIHPEIGELHEMLYEFTRPFVMSDTATREALQLEHTPLDVALRETIAHWHEPH